ncbi:isopentenyl-diphosphate delta-isomerase [Streptomyces sp. TLI_053]|uniref:type 2 isopentenyl-diphosphate Delta-isomerase n=1 Tax=Streptomyces sp. TLI_053 TaxID=1855352 RepID=UPI00087D20CE|nr:type 2 isopentenyl-diphosphate Delta-isomerase [Streptomyces sp. TLI_053]SDS53959.1 isopentenyl-diphosphate delta-isomerase [Streptomyces sp. TLI_053]
MSAERKDDHVRHAHAQHQQRSGRNDFDDVSFIHHALAGIDSDSVDLSTSFGGLNWPLPLYINAMTGGSAMTGAINRTLAIAAHETGVPMATGSVSAYFADARVADTFTVVRKENPNGFVMANINANASPDRARQAIDLLQANALQIHLNAVQEIVMPEGDRSFGHWPARIQAITAAVAVPVIVKEVGFGLSRRTIELLHDLGVTVADVSGRGGTDFALIENQRRPATDYACLGHWGQSAPACLLDSQGLGVDLLASGGVRHALDVARALALGARAVGASSPFLAQAVEGGEQALIAHIRQWLEQLTALMTVLGARTPADLTSCDVLIGGDLRHWCIARGIDPTAAATRSAHPPLVPAPTRTGTTRGTR